MGLFGWDGLSLVGAARLGAGWSEMAGLHVAFMGGLGLSLYAVFTIAGLLHTHRPLQTSGFVRLGALLLVSSVAVRLAPEFGVNLHVSEYGLATIFWASAQGVWLYIYLPTFCCCRNAPKLTGCFKAVIEIS